MQVPILSGIYVDNTTDFRTSYPRNLIPVPKDNGIAKGYLGPTPGLVVFGNAAGPGVDRGGINWNGQCYRVMGTKLVQVGPTGSISVLGEVRGIGPVSMDYSFDRLAIASGDDLFYWNGATLSQVTDPDLLAVHDMLWVDGYFMFTDGTTVGVTELNDPMSVDPLKYGSSEADPDPIVGLNKIRIEVSMVNRYTIESLQNVGGDNFPFQRIDGAQITKGAVGKKMFCTFLDSIAFVGSGRDEAPAVYLATSGQEAKISTREIDIILEGYTEAQLSQCITEARVSRNHQHLCIHLPDQTLVYDGAASAAATDPVWFTATSSIVGNVQYRAQQYVWCYDKWIFGDPQSSNLGTFAYDVSTHYGTTIGWEFGTLALYAGPMGAIVHDLELIGLPGGVPFGKKPVIWTSYSLDGKSWSQEMPIDAGSSGQTGKRLWWDRQGGMRNWRIQKFRGTSDAHFPMTRLEMNIEPLGAAGG